MKTGELAWPLRIRSENRLSCGDRAYRELAAGGGGGGTVVLIGMSSGYESCRSAEPSFIPIPLSFFEWPDAASSSDGRLTGTLCDPIADDAGPSDCAGFCVCLRVWKLSQAVSVSDLLRNAWKSCMSHPIFSTKPPAPSPIKPETLLSKLRSSRFSAIRSSKRNGEGLKEHAD